MRGRNRWKFFNGVYDCHVGFGLIFENAQLGRAIITASSDTGRDGRERS